MNRRKNVSFIVLGVVSLLFLFSLTFLSDANTSEPVTASTAELLEEQEEQANNEQSQSSSSNTNGSGDSQISNEVNNTVDANDGDVTNTVENEVNSTQSQVDNQITNEINSDHTSINNTIDNHISADGGNVDNAIDNSVDSSEHSDIQNSINNDIHVTVDVNVTNQINNQVTGEQRADSNGNGENGEDQNGDDSSNGENANGENGNGNGEETPETVWGVDSASITTEEMLACVRNNFGDPEIWGRYLGTNEGASYGLTAEEVELLHAEDIQILVIYNHFNDGTGYEHGQDHAQAAIEMARDFGIPEGVALFANVEPIYPIDSDFILGWHDAVTESEYNSGIYGVFDPSQEVYVAFEAAADANPNILDEMHVWTAAPNEGITTEDNAPVYNPSYPDGALIGGWQYGLDAETCNIDTNIFDGNVLDVLW